MAEENSLSTPVIVVKDVEELFADTPIVGALAIHIDTYGMDGFPGVCPYSGHHGIAGISLADVSEKAYYVPIKFTTRNAVGEPYTKEGVQLGEAIRKLNKLIKTQIVVFRSCKDALGFLIEYGLVTTDVKTFFDVEVACALACNGPDSGQITERGELLQEEAEFLAQSSREYDKLTTEELAESGGHFAKFLCWELTQYLKCLSPIELEMVHMYIRACINLVAAEARGMLFAPDYAGRLTMLDLARVEYAGAVKNLLSGVKIDIHDDNMMLHYLHTQGMQGPAKIIPGTTLKKYVFDPEQLKLAIKNPLAKNYYWMYILKQVSDSLSVDNPASKVYHRVAPEALPKDYGSYGRVFYPSFGIGNILLGSTLNSMVPDLSKFSLDNSIRRLFRPRPGHSFVRVSSYDLELMLLGFYLENNKLIAAVQTQDEAEVDGFFAGVLTGKEPHCRISLIVRSLVEGVGMSVLKRRYAVFNVDNENCYADREKVVERVGDMGKFEKKLKKKLAETKRVICDLLKRKYFLPVEQEWRGLSWLIRSSAGGFMAVLLNAVSSYARDQHGHLVFCHGNELLFELPDDTAELFAVGVEQQKFSFGGEQLKPYPSLHTDVCRETWTASTNFVDRYYRQLTIGAGKFLECDSRKKETKNAV